ncbi:MAG: sulfite exporter TauE/SafE family protein, partial [Candidatus Sericytochromatia bacterium]|nr:sulfite exporter TauE/SafE family protein [Candidatus Sericytochromatia bacterium]
MEIGYGLMALTGLLSGFGHCVGMCGPLVATYTLQNGGDRLEAAGTAVRRHFLAHIGYNAGRITTYTAMGAVMGTIGSFVQVATRLAGLQHLLTTVAGLAMILMGLNMAGYLPKWRQSAGMAAPGPYQRLVNTLVNGSRGRGHYLLGLALGLLPCGVLYTAQIAAAASGSAARGAGLMLSFGLGTVPALLAVGVMASWLGPRLRGNLYRLASVTVMVAGG